MKILVNFRFLSTSSNTKTNIRDKYYITGCAITIYLFFVHARLSDDNTMSKTKDNLLSSLIGYKQPEKTIIIAKQVQLIRNCI